MKIPTGRGAAVLVLLSVTVIWGSTFLVTKQSLDSVSVATLLFWRFGLSAVLLLVAAPRRIAALSRQEWRWGLILGVFLGAGFLAQTQGLKDTSAAISGFLTGMMLVFTPLVAATVFAERVTARGWAAVAVATVGLALISLQGWQLSPGAGVTVVGAACFAVQIAGLSHWATPANSYAVTTVSVAVAAVMAGAVGLGSGTLTVPTGAVQWGAIFYLAVLATCVCLVAQAWSQSHLSATTSAVIMTMEPVFAGVIAVVIGGESLAARAWWGGAMIVAAMFIAELGPRGGRDTRNAVVQPL